MSVSCEVHIMIGGEDRMRKKEVLTRSYVCNPYEADCLREKLEVLSEKGWLLEQVEGNRFTFRKGLPRRLRYFIDVRMGETEDEVKNQHVVCENGLSMEECGWEILGMNDTIVVYRSKAMHPSAICLEPKERLKYINQANGIDFARKLFGNLIPLIIIIWQLQGYVSQIIASGFTILCILAGGMCTLDSVSEVCTYIVWYLKGRIRARQKKVFRYRSGSSFRLQSAVHWGVACSCLSLLLLEGLWKVVSLGKISLLVSGVIFSLLLGGIAGILNYWGRKQVVSMNILYWNVEWIQLVVCICLVIVLLLSEHGVFDSIRAKEEIEVTFYSWTETVKIYEDELPVTLEDLGQERIAALGIARNQEKKIQTSLFATRIEYEDKAYLAGNYNGIGMEYRIYQSDYPWLVAQDALEEYFESAKEMESSARMVMDERWGAKAVYCFTEGEETCYLALYDDVSIWISCDFELGDEQIEKFTELIQKDEE